MKTRLLGSFKSSKLILFSAFTVAALVSSALFADVSGDSNNDGGFITDNNTGGVVSTITITDSEIISSARFCLEGLQHTWIGDLIVTVSHLESGRSATLLNRIGTTSNPASTGDDSNVNGTYEFADRNGSLWTAAANGDTAFNVAPGTYDASGVNESVVSLDSVFEGANTAGTWQFNISDNNATQFGSFTQTAVKFESTAIPEPGTMATVVIGTLFGGVYFRRRHQKKSKTEDKETAA